MSIVDNEMVVRKNMIVMDVSTAAAAGVVAYIAIKSIKPGSL